MPEQQPLDAIIAGAGLAGLYQLHRLRELGLRARIIEAGDGVGGTWHWNRYPGARCDIESLSYSYSFSPELEQEWDWTERYPAQPEILRYIEHVADRFDLRRDISFSTRVTGAHFDESRSLWTFTTDTGERPQARYAVMATGCLSVPKYPEAPGLDRFAGPSFHTGRWGKEPADFTGMRVAVIGTGSSGIQAIPVIASQAAELTVFQRTPSFSLPAMNRPLTRAEIAEMKADYPSWRQAQRTSRAGIPGPVPTKPALEVSPAERAAAYEHGWQQGRLGGLTGAFTDTLISQEANDLAAEFVRAKIRGIVRDPAVAAAVSPRSFPIGTKRLCLDTGYYQTFNLPHVRLVDLRETPLAEITRTGVRTSDRHYRVDAIVYATGFDAMTGALNAIDIRGRGGRALSSVWRSGPRAYLGLAVAGFPNLFLVTGPGSPSVLSNMIVSIEQHVDWIAGCLAWLRDRGITQIEATGQAQDAWVRHVAEVASFTLFPKANSWYMGANVPGKPRVFMPYLGGVGSYREKCDEVAAGGYEGFTLRGETSPP